MSSKQIQMTPESQEAQDRKFAEEHAKERCKKAGVVYSKHASYVIAVETDFLAGRESARKETEGLAKEVALIIKDADEYFEKFHPPTKPPTNQEMSDE